MVVTMGISSVARSEAPSVASSEAAHESASVQTATTALIALIDGFDRVTGRFQQSILDLTNEVIEDPLAVWLCSGLNLDGRWIRRLHN